MFMLRMRLASHLRWCVLRLRKSRNIYPRSFSYEPRGKKKKKKKRQRQGWGALGKGETQTKYLNTEPVLISNFNE